MNLMQSILPSGQVMDAQKCNRKLASSISTDVAHGAYSHSHPSRTNVRKEDSGSYSISNDAKNKHPTISACRSRSNDDSEDLYSDIDVTSDTLPYKGDNMNRKRKADSNSQTNLKKYKTHQDLSIATEADIAERVSLFAEDSDMDNKVRDLCQSSTEQSDDSDINLEEISNDLFDEDEVGPPVIEGLSSLFNNIKEKPLPKTKIADKCKKILRPKNCNLETKKCNLEIWNNALKFTDRSIDIKIQKANKLISKSAYALLNVTNDLITLRSSKDKKPKLKSKTTDALSLLVNAYNDSEQFRRDLIAKKLIHSQKSISKNVPSDSKLLFGDELSKRVKEANAATKLKVKTWKGVTSTNASTTTSTSKNFRRSSKYPKGQHQGHSNNNNNGYGKNKKKKY